MPFVIVKWPLDGIGVLVELCFLIGECRLWKALYEMMFSHVLTLFLSSSLRV